jgi:predicted translin family RNA/ssDNA-binding protein
MVDFNKLKQDYEKFEHEREELILASRIVVQLSKKVIYSVHRGDAKGAEKSIAEIKKAVKDLDKFKDAKHIASSSYKIAIQEYVEALSYAEYVKNNTLLTYEKLGVDHEHYLLGICDLTGELVRKALSAGIDGKYGEVYKIRVFVNDLYDELQNFDFRNSEVRKKFDQIRWDLKKLDEMALQLKLKETK